MYGWEGRMAQPTNQRNELEGRVRDAAGVGLSRAADAAHRAGEWAERRGGPAARAATTAHDAEDRLTRAASYVRHRDVDGMKADFERQVDRHPVRALLLAAGMGFLLGRLVR